MLLRFLKDQALAYRLGVLTTWEAGTLKPTEEQELRGRVQAIDELQELTLSDMKRFYGIEPEQPAEPER